MNGVSVGALNNLQPGGSSLNMHRPTILAFVTKYIFS